MSPDDLDAQARKQLLLTRIAAQRGQLRLELARVGEAARLPNLLRAASAEAGPIGRSLIGLGVAPVQGGWLRLALTLLRRYKGAATLIGAAAPLLRRGGLHRVVRIARLGGLAAMAWVGWRLLKGRSADRS